VAAGTFDGLVREMNRISDDEVDGPTLRDEIERYDAHIERGSTYHNDDQLRRLAHLRNYRGDRVRTCKEQKILDPDATSLIAIREFILSRKSLGGLQTDLDGRVLHPPAADGFQETIPGLYAVGEAAGFGGGGIHGLRSLEGTFLGTCILGGRLAGQAIADGG
jgi:predicted oxidoreductase